jgi:hypothetical protein
MKTNKVFYFMILSFYFITACSKEDTPPEDKITYNKDVKSIMVSKCAPCHVEGGVQPSKFDSYTTAKAKIDAIQSRINLDPAAQGFMPKNGSKLSAVEISILEKWKTDGLLEN